MIFKKKIKAQTVINLYSNYRTTYYVKSCQTSCNAGYTSGPAFDSSGTSITQSVFTTCCQTNNCNALPIGTCYVGTSPNDKITSCSSPNNMYCQVRITFNSFSKKIKIFLLFYSILNLNSVVKKPLKKTSFKRKTKK